MAATEAAAADVMAPITAPDRVVVINDDAVPRGGAGAIALASAGLMRERQIPVAFLSGTAEIDSSLTEHGVETAVLGGRHLLAQPPGAAALRGLFDPSTRVALSRWIAANDTPRTIYHLHNWHKVLSPSVFVSLRAVAPRLVMTAHDYFLACPNGGYFIYPQQHECGLVPNSPRCLTTACDRRNFRHKIWRHARHCMRQSLIALDALPVVVIAVHEAMVPLLARGAVPACRTRVVRNPVVPWCRERVPAERNRDVFFVGRLDGDKGPDLLARAARRAGVRLRLIGDGPLAASIARDYPEVELLGWRSRTEIAELIREARMVVSPTRSRETFGLVALEALTSGIPVIVSQFFALAAEIAEGRLGRVCNPYDEMSLAAAIRDLAKDDDEVADISRRAFIQAGAMAPTPAQWCDELLALYADRVEEARAC